MSATVGRANLTSESGEGLYTASLDYGTDYITAAIAKIDEEIAAIEASILTLSGDIIANDNEGRSLRAIMDGKINALRAADPADVKAAFDAVTAAAKDVIAKENEAAPLRREAASLEVTKANLTAKRGRLAALNLTESKALWCADYTTEATGSVATIEINGEPPSIIIAPGAPAPSAADGYLQDGEAMIGASTYLNNAILPGWQKWKPTFRAGQLTAIDRANNTGDVSLDAALSSAQNLNINQSSTLSAVTFDYMTCNHLAFQVGDDVVVQFEGQDWTRPKIIGFVSNPKQCGPERLILPLAFANNGTSSYPETLLQNTSVWQRDVQWSECVGGQLFVTDLGGSPPPGYLAGGQFRNAITNLYTFTPAFSAGNILIAENEALTGSIGEFDWTEDYEVQGSPPDIEWTLQEDLLGSSLNTSGFGFQVDDWTDLDFTGTAINNIRVERRNFNLNADDTTIDADSIDCQSEVFMRYFSGLPSTVTLASVEGGEGIPYEFYRFWTASSIVGLPESPATMLQGLSLGYRRVRA